MVQLPQAIIDRFEDLNASEAYSVLSILDTPNISVYFNSRLNLVKDIIESDVYNWMMAKEIKPIVFWGGPPTNLKWYEGSLKTLVFDRVQDYLCKHSIRHLLNHLELPEILLSQKIQVWL